jgi:type I restriction enzyme R subunit
MSAVNEAMVEEAALEWFAGLGYTAAHRLTPDAEDPGAERRAFNELLRAERLRAAIARLNPRLPEEARAEALKRVQRGDGPVLFCSPVMMTWP